MSFIVLLFMEVQSQHDSLPTILLPQVDVPSFRHLQDIQRLGSVQGTYIHSGKKNEVIDLSQKTVALSEKYARQIFSKVPGIFVYDMDGTGNQLNISTRGLDPHRGWEYNMRKDGLITNSDMYGYPASHYNIPMEAVQRIEIVRGTGSLQYGAQFGGMINYVSKDPDSTKTFELENYNTIGSYGLVSNFIRVAGTKSKFRYNIWFNKKQNDGYRDNSDSKFDAQNISLWYLPNKNFSIKAEFTRSKYLTHIPGALTDSLFKVDPTRSTRSRNYYSPQIMIPSLQLKWRINGNTHFEWTNSALLGDRSSVMFDKAANVADTLISATGSFANRQVDIDNYHSYTSEMRLLHHYKLAQISGVFTGGIQYMNNDLHRRQLGKGTVGSNYNLDLVESGWGRDLHYKTSNIAAFIENKFSITSKLNINVGARLESGETRMSGTISYYPDDQLDNTISHRFPLLGAGFQYDVTKQINAYGGWSQAYRPVIFKDIIPGSVYEIADKNLKDAKGYNGELGIRGRYKFLNWDVSAFLLEYKNRLGTIAQTDSTGHLTIFRTNIGDSFTSGVECFVEGKFDINKNSGISVYTASSYMDARYRNAQVRSGGVNKDISGYRVESVPYWISRNGMSFRYREFNLSLLYSYVSSSFADALNNTKPNASASSGLVPEYDLFDMNASLAVHQHITVQVNANNIFNEKYYTKRPQFYPGPGIWPSDGRTFSATLIVRI